MAPAVRVDAALGGGRAARRRAAGSECVRPSPGRAGGLCAQHGREARCARERQWEIERRWCVSQYEQKAGMLPRMVALLMLVARKVR